MHKKRKNKENPMSYRRKTVSLKPEHVKWVKENHISLSRFLQDAIDMEIKKGRK